MKKLLILGVLAYLLLNALPAFAQKGNKFTFHNKEADENFPKKGQSFVVEGDLIAFEAGNMIVDYEIYYYAKQRAKEGDVLLTLVTLTAPMLGKDKKKFVSSVKYFYLSPKVCEGMTMLAVAGKDGFYELNAKGKGIPTEEISRDKAETTRFGFEEDSYGFGSVRVGKFKTTADFEKFKKMLQL